MAQSPEMPVFDLIYLDAPPAAAPVDRGVDGGLAEGRPVQADIADMIAQRPTGPGAARSTDAGASGAQTPEGARLRLASLTAPSVAEAFTPMPRARIIGTDVTGIAAQDILSQNALSPGELALALQQELARVGCYRLRVDGQWGPGSRRALNSYLARSGQSADGREPTPALVRMVRDSPAGICPAPVAAPRVSQPARTTTPSAPRPVQPQPAAPVATAPPASGGASRLEGALRSGFR